MLRISAPSRDPSARYLRWRDAKRDADRPRSEAYVHRVGAHAGGVTLAVLLAVARSLERGRVEHFLIDRARSGSRLGAPMSSLPDILEVLRNLGHRMPIRLEAHDSKGAVLWSGFAVGLSTVPPETTQVLCFVSVVDPISGLQLGRQEGCTLEFWKRTRMRGLAAPVKNRRTAEVAQADRVAGIDVSVDGCPVRTIPPFSLPDPDDIEFPIDAVVLWVDGSDPEWQKRREQRKRELGLPPDDPGNVDKLFRTHGELRYLFRSIERYAPWLRHIYLVTAGQRPPWLVTSHPRLRLVDHEDFIPRTALPVFSSRPIIASLHRIDELAEHYLMFNDDVVLGQMVRPQQFFTSGGLTKYFPSRSTIPRERSDIPHLGARQVVAGLLAERYGVWPTRTFWHAPHAMRRRTMEAIEDWFGDHLNATIHRPFRSPDDVVTEWLHHYVGQLEGWAIRGRVSYAYHQVGSIDAVDRLDAHLTDRRDVIGLNDSGDIDLHADEIATRLTAFLDRFLPLPSSFERDADEHSTLPIGDGEAVAPKIMFDGGARGEWRLPNAWRSLVRLGRR